MILYPYESVYLYLISLDIFINSKGMISGEGLLEYPWG